MFWFMIFFICNELYQSLPDILCFICRAVKRTMWILKLSFMNIIFS